MKAMRFIFISLISIGGILYANTASTYAYMHYSHMCKYHNKCYLFCESCPDDMVRIGVGGVYGEYHSSNPQNFSLTGGYINFYVRGASPKERVQFVLDSHFGVGRGTWGNFPITQERANTLGLFTEVRSKLGLNLLTQNVPLYLNIAYTFNLNNSDSGANNTNGFSNYLHQVGAELEGIIKSSENLQYEYSVGYDYVFSGFYRARADGTQADIENYSYVLRASLGFAYNLSENMHYYMKLKAKYYNIAQSGIYPQMQNYIGMLELGIGF